MGNILRWYGGLQPPETSSQLVSAPGADVDRQVAGHSERRPQSSSQQNNCGEGHLPNTDPRSVDENARTRASPRLELTATSTSTNNSTSHHFYDDHQPEVTLLISAGPVSQYDLTNASNISLAVGDQRPKGCLTDDNLRARIHLLHEVFVEVYTFKQAKHLLKTYGHVTIAGAPGDGKTSIALMLCEAYRLKGYQTLFVENIEDFNVDVVSKNNTDLLIVFDDVFGSVTFTCNVEKVHKVIQVLNDVLVSEPEHWRNNGNHQSEDKSKDGGRAAPTRRLRVVFTSRTYNLSEGVSRLFLYKFSLFKTETVINLTKSLSSDEKTNILMSFAQWRQISDISRRDIKSIIDCQNDLFGFPFICKLYFTTAAFQINTLDFFQNPLTYLRCDLDLIVRECSSRSAAVILLILCGGKLDLVSIQMKRDDASYTESVFLAVKEVIPSCTRTDIRRELINFNGTYCTVEQQTVTFSHPSVYEAASCSLGKLNIILLLNYCSLKFLYDRIRVGKRKLGRLPEPDDVTNMIYIDESLYPLVVSRLVESIKHRHFSMTVNHPVMENDDICSMVLACSGKILPNIIQEKDKDTKKCFLYWASLSGSSVLFMNVLSTAWEIIQDTPENQEKSEMLILDLYDALVTCVQNGILTFVQQTAALLKRINRFNADFKTKENKTLLMIASERCHLNVFNFLLEEGADLTLILTEGKTCLYLASESGCEGIAKVIVSLCPDMIDVPADDDRTPAMISAESGHLGLLKFLASKGADLTHTDQLCLNCLHVACYKQHLAIVKFLLSVEDLDLDINQRGGYFNRTPILMAAAGGSHDVYNLLVSKGADLSLTDKNNRDCLMWASLGGNMSIVKHLLSLKIFNINRRGGYYNRTPVMMAVAGGQYGVFQLLVSEGADLFLTDSHRRDCLMLACVGGDVFILKQLFSLKAFDVNRRASGQTPVMLAAKFGWYDIFMLLVANGADLSQSDVNHGNCLMIACHGGNVSIVRHILSMKIFDINKTGGLFGHTPAMAAAYFGHFPVYQLLVSEGADLSVIDKHNTDFLMTACEGGNVSIVKHLLSLKTFNINRRGGPFNCTPLQTVFKTGRRDIYDILVSEGAEDFTS